MPNAAKYALSLSLKKLLSNHGLDKITVKELVEDCGVNRQTFYYYFRDIYDLLEWTFQEDAEHFLRGTEHRDWKQGLWEVMAYLRENRTLVWNAYHSISHEAVSGFLKRTLHPFIGNTVEAEATDLKQPVRQENIEFATDICTLMAVGIITEWITQQEPRGGEERLEKFLVAINGSARLMLQNLEGIGAETSR